MSITDLEVFKAHLHVVGVEEDVSAQIYLDAAERAVADRIGAELGEDAWIHIYKATWLGPSENGTDIIQPPVGCRRAICKAVIKSLDMDWPNRCRFKLSPTFFDQGQCEVAR